MQYFSYTKSFEQNKAAYRSLVKEHHPDKGGKQSDFLELQKQWEFYQLNYKNPKTEADKATYNDIFKNVQFTNVVDVEAYYNANRVAINELAKRIFSKKKHDKKLDDAVRDFGFSLGKSIFDLFK